jgi:hypothetical protein
MLLIGQQGFWQEQEKVTKLAEKKLVMTLLT